MSSRSVSFALVMMLLFAGLVSADDNCYPLVYGCLGGSAACAVAALIYGFRRPVEIDVDEVQREAMVIRRPPGFLIHCMEPKESGLTNDELRSPSEENSVENALP